MGPLEQGEVVVERAIPGVALRQALVDLLAAALPRRRVALYRPYLGPDGVGLTDVHTAGWTLDDLLPVAEAAHADGPALVHALLRLPEEHLLDPPVLDEAPQHEATWARVTDPLTRWVVRSDRLLGVVVLVGPPIQETPEVLASWAMLLRKGLVRAAALGPGDAPLTAIADERGEVVLDEPETGDWTRNPLVADRIRRWVARAAHGPPWLGLGGRHVDLVPLRHRRERASRWLLRLPPAPIARREGRHLLTPRQLQVAEGAARGARNDELAEVLGLAPGTIKVHLRHIYKTLGIRGRAELGRALSARLEEQVTTPA